MDISMLLFVGFLVVALLVGAALLAKPFRMGSWRVRPSVLGGVLFPIGLWVAWYGVQYAKRDPTGSFVELVAVPAGLALATLGVWALATGARRVP